MDNAAVVAQAVAAMREAAAADAHTWNCATNGSLPFPCDCKYPALATRLLSAADALAGVGHDTARLDWLERTRPEAYHGFWSEPNGQWCVVEKYTGERNVIGTGNTLRAAIDHAINAARAAQEPTP